MAERKKVAIMNIKTRALNGFLTLAASLLMGATLESVKAQNPPPQNQIDQNQSQVAQADQMLGPLNLTADQIQKIRAINAELKDQRQAANLRLRQAQRALAEAVESPNPNEALIEQRSREVADAQAATIRLRSLTEARIRQVLTPEQRIKLQEIKQRNQALRRMSNQQLPANGLGRPREGLRRNPNALPVGPRQQRKLIRQQRRP
jgi:Spy/CpxP family protein refolding chaperone